MRTNIIIGLLIFSVLILVGCNNINSESQATEKAEKFAENLWIKAYEDTCTNPPCEIMEHWVKTTDVKEKENSWVITVEIERYDPESELKAKSEDNAFVKELLESLVYVKKYFDIEVSKSGEIRCLKASSPFNLVTPCEERKE